MPEKPDHMRDIIRKCLQIDECAAQVYKTFIELNLPSPLDTLFKTLLADETGHIKYWEELFKLSGEGEVLEVFEDAEKILYEITALSEKVSSIRDESLRLPATGSEKLLILVIEMEYVLLHPSFIALFSFTGASFDRKSMEEEYTEHIDHICGALNSHASVNSLFPVTSDLIRRVWQETKRLVSLNQSDVLSGILNRRGFHEQIRPLLFLALRKRYTVAVMLLDVDHFKGINDNYGHQAGDRVLKLVASYIRDNVRQSDIAARYGGDEFIVFFLDVRRKALIGMAEKIKSGIEAASDKIAVSTVSIGIALAEASGKSGEVLDRLIKEADKALYEAKQGGRNTFRIQKLKES